MNSAPTVIAILSSGEDVSLPKLPMATVLIIFDSAANLVMPS